MAVLGLLVYQVEQVLTARLATRVRLEVEGHLETLEQPVRLEELVVLVSKVSVV